MFNFHEKVKKQTGRATGDGVFGFFALQKKPKTPSPVALPVPSTYPDNNLHAIITVSSYMISAISSTDFTR